MRLTTFTDYTLRVLMYLALNREELVTIPTIAAAYGISENHLMKVVYQLSRAGVVESTRGKGGGIRLACEPGDVRLGAIVRQSEGAAPIVECLGEEAGACCIAPACTLHGILEEAFAALYKVLDSYSLADLIGSNRQMLGRLLQRM
jgi:Rrf2 family nitric oxide-sensitive transcriptional repressor